MKIPAAGFVSLNDPDQANAEIVAVKPGTVFLLLVNHIRCLFQDIAGGGVVMSKFFSQHTGFFCLSVNILPDGYSPITV